VGLEEWRRVPRQVQRHFGQQERGCSLGLACPLGDDAAVSVTHPGMYSIGVKARKTPGTAAAGGRLGEQGLSSKPRNNKASMA
jgi:hypothetical protein